MKKYCDRDFRIRICIIQFDSYQFALKIWKSFSWMIQKKHDLTISLFVVVKIESLISYNSQFSIWWLTTNWLTMNFEFESFFIFLFFFFVYRIHEKFKREKRRCRDRIRYIKFRKFFWFFFSFHILFVVQSDRTTIFENVFDTIQFFMRRKF